MRFGLKLLILVIISLSMEAFADNGSCYPKDPFKDLDNIMESAACAELPVGKSKIVNLIKHSSPTKVPHKYELVRVSPDKYKVRLNIQFREDTLRARADTDLTKKMRAKVQQCIEWMNPHLLGLNNQKLEVELIEPRESNTEKYEDIVNYVSVSKEPVHRANSELYSIDSSCSTISHELLHLMGLVDEYKESEYISWYEDDCRSLGPPDSVMVDHSDLDDLDDKIVQKRIVSCCVCKDQSCAKVTETGSLKSCPKGYDTIKAVGRYYRDSAAEEVLASEKQSCNSLMGGFIGMSGYGKKSRDSFFLSTNPSSKAAGSLIYPAHFRAITAPGCKKKNSTYYSCARDAYFRPYKLIGSCDKRPPQCEEPEAWLK